MSSQISMRELHSHLSKLGEKEIILDVRGRDEFAEGHIRGAMNIPHDEVAQHVQELKRYERIYIHCHAGRRAQLAHGILEKHGLRNLVCISDGGMGDWISAGYETEKGA